MAGPLLNEDEAMAGSLIIFEADDLDAARVVCAEDPYVIHGVFEHYDVIETQRCFREVTDAAMDRAPPGASHSRPHRVSAEAPDHQSPHPALTLVQPTVQSWPLGASTGRCAKLSWKLKRLQTLWFDDVA